MKEEKNKRAFERLVDKAMEDDYWIELLHMQTGLPFDKKRTEIAGIFKRHVIIMGNDSQIISEKDAKNYFANFSRKGSITHKAILAELKREKTTLWKGKENPYRYEETDARTGERSYCGIPIPSDAPPRPDANSVWNKNHSCWEL
ncbi:MAG: hypothetical protein LBU44_01380 [Mediterranea sp.]|nr:hypothetical protein [Mediterranea sp.]